MIAQPEKIIKVKNKKIVKNNHRRKKRILYIGKYLLYNIYREH